MKTLFFVLCICTIGVANAQEIAPADTTKAKKEGEFVYLNPNPTLINKPLKAPLYIVDDVEIAENKITKIKANDIESITVVKDSTAVAKYGEKAKYGVIIIEMKKQKFKLE